MAITVHVTKDDILEGEAGDCHRCAVALATSRTTGGEAMVFEDRDYRIRVGVDGWSFVAPEVVRAFVRDFDDLPRDDVDGRLDVNDPGCKVPEPIEFELPPPRDPRWELECGSCGYHFAGHELDDDGLCEDCR